MRQRMRSCMLRRRALRGPWGPHFGTGRYTPKGQLFGGSGLGGPTTQATVVAGRDCAVAYHFAPVARGLMKQRLSPLGDVQRRCPGAVIFRSTSNSMVAGAR